LGLDRYVIVGPGFHPEGHDGKQNLFVSHVLPQVRAALR